MVHNHLAESKSLKLFGQGLQIQQVRGYPCKTYLLSFSYPSEMHGLVIKVIPCAVPDCIVRATRESNFLAEVRSKTEGCTFPRHLAMFQVEGGVVFVSELLPGTMITETVVGKSEVARVAAAIRHTQQALSTTSIGNSMILSSYEQSSYYPSKIATHLKRYFGMIVDRKELSFLDLLDRLRREFPVVVSDRSPANFVINADNIGAYDFEVALTGIVFEDWSWFIDDPRLNSLLSRSDLIETFCHDFVSVNGGSGNALIEAFHISSVFVCIKQYCFMLARGQRAMAKHYLQCAEQSAKEVSLTEAINLIGKLRRMLPLFVNQNI